VDPNAVVVHIVAAPLVIHAVQISALNVVALIEVAVHSVVVP
jgi:hypothetical protein